MDKYPSPKGEPVPGTKMFTSCLGYPHSFGDWGPVIGPNQKLPTKTKVLFFNHFIASFKGFAKLILTKIM